MARNDVRVDVFDFFFQLVLTVIVKFWGAAVGGWVVRLGQRLQTLFVVKRVAKGKIIIVTINLDYHHFCGTILIHRTQRIQSRSLKATHTF